MDKRNNILYKIFTKKDRIIHGNLRNCLQKWNLRAKIIAIANLAKEDKKFKKLKSKKNVKKKDKKQQK